MSENCSHDCNSCKENCNNRTIEKEMQNEKSNVKKVIGVISGKGGVGKSFVTSMLAIAANRKGNKVAVLDADITGPSIPKLFGLKEKAYSPDGKNIIPVESEKGIKIMSINLLLENDTDPVVWRGPIIAGTVKQFWTDVMWGDVDYMFVDMPPGTGDVPLTVFQSLPIDGIIIVSTPQELVSIIVEKAVKMAEMMNIPILGLVENMSYYVCPKCGEKISVFGDSKIDSVAKKLNIAEYEKIPLDPKIAEFGDKGYMEKLQNGELEKFFDKIVRKF
ncbi:MAG: Mrp/NBP35 family ATP-binding protein [Clostridia bacterium]|nr:Mrp/NBP35 family ATP-binding protein [Clostridia bacterium]